MWLSHTGAKKLYYRLCLIIVLQNYITVRIFICNKMLHFRTQYCMPCNTYIQDLIWKIGRGSSECRQVTFAVLKLIFWFYSCTLIYIIILFSHKQIWQLTFKKMLKYLKRRVNKCSGYALSLSSVIGWWQVSGVKGKGPDPQTGKYNTAGDHRRSKKNIIWDWWYIGWILLILEQY